MKTLTIIFLSLVSINSFATDVDGTGLPYVGDYYETQTQVCVAFKTDVDGTGDITDVDGTGEMIVICKDK